MTERNYTDEEWYALVINELTEKFTLLSWEGLSDNALRGIIPDYFKLQGRFVVFDSMGVLNSMLIRVVPREQ